MAVPNKNKRVTRRTYHIKATRKQGGGTEEWKVKGTSMEYHCDGELYHLCIWDKKTIIFAIDWGRVISAYAEGTAQVQITEAKSTNRVAGVQPIKLIKE
jgi:hypothetical protein